MRIDKALNLIIPIERDDGVILFAHSTPIDEGTFVAYHRAISMTYAQLTADGLIGSGGVRNPDLMLRDVCTRAGLWDDDPQTKTIGVERGLLGEIRRLTNVFAPTGDKWEMVPLSDCERSDILSPREVREVEAAAVFFTCASRNFPRQNLREFLQMCSGRIGAHVTFSSCTDLQRSLPTWTGDENSGERVAEWWAEYSKLPAPASDSEKS